MIKKIVLMMLFITITFTQDFSLRVSVNTIGTAPGDVWYDCCNHIGTSIFATDNFDLMDTLDTLSMVKASFIVDSNLCMADIKSPISMYSSKQYNLSIYRCTPGTRVVIRWVDIYEIPENFSLFIHSTSSPTIDMRKTNNYSFIYSTPILFTITVYNSALYIIETEKNENKDYNKRYYNLLGNETIPTKNGIYFEKSNNNYRKIILTK